MSFCCCYPVKNLPSDADAEKAFRYSSSSLHQSVVVVPTPTATRGLPTKKKSIKEKLEIVPNSSLATAITSCKAQVATIVAECREKNRYFRDMDFDLSQNEYECLSSLAQDWDRCYPGGALRVRDIFSNPIFCEVGYDASDVKDGYAPWFMSAVASVCSMPGLMERVCAARDESVGVYGFVFFKDGEWVPVIVDDQLFVKFTDFDHEYTGIEMDKATFNATLRSGSSALSFAQSSSENETWLPLLEKAYAKLHGDYKSIEIGLTGEALEDLTGGVTTRTFLKDVSDTDALWERDIVARLLSDSLFSATIETKQSYVDLTTSEGLLHLHPYAILRAVEACGRRFVQLRNPQRGQEWSGRWSDGSSLWTNEFVTALNHTGGDDGCFWMEWCDFLDEFTHIERTLILLDNDTTITPLVPQPLWKSIRATWPAKWQQKMFTFTVPTALSRVTIVLQQADIRRFVGLGGIYKYGLRFGIYRIVNNKRTLVTQYVNSSYNRSSSIELALRPAVYEVDIMVMRTSSGSEPIEDVISNVGAFRPDKLLERCDAFNASRLRADDKLEFDVLAMVRDTQLTEYEKLHKKQPENDSNNDGALTGSVIVGLRLFAKMLV
ncbi:hypothetical protein THRCLA_12011 [Thraustotheca clavata]|uniref:Calpain catalytic domain-containing protein n=1 Tax=Thraustotheca clavata TaxID=74557 RepID=A0A1V9Y463_9STRA|nr:hypothetical protein THRCLA_12011 [Thraustotheca clavata]